LRIYRLKSLLDTFESSGKTVFGYGLRNAESRPSGRSECIWRGETETLDKMEKRVALDMEYIKNWSAWLDLKIVWLTIWRGLAGERAY